MKKTGRDSRWSRPGVKKSTAFAFHLERETKRVAVYEACIDALAHMTLEEGK